MWMMLQQDEPDDFVVAPGETHTVREFAGLAWKKYVVIDPKFLRPAEVELLVGDPARLRRTSDGSPG